MTQHFAKQIFQALNMAILKSSDPGVVGVFFSFSNSPHITYLLSSTPPTPKPNRFLNEEVLIVRT